MRALLRYFNGEVYVWKDVTYDESGFRVGTTQISETDIVALEDDNRNEYIKCSACGKLFRKGSEEWTEHIKPIVDTHKCFECRYLRTENSKLKEVKYTLQDDGTYNAVQQSNVCLKCLKAYKGWSYQDINSEAARKACEFNRCTVATQKEITDVFTEHPDVFDDIITVDKIIEAGYKERRQYGNDTEYLLKGKNIVYAIVNSLNIVDHFSVHFRNQQWMVYYSSKYDKFYEKSSEYRYNRHVNTYKPWRPLFSPNTEEYIKKKIASLYK